MLPLAMLVILSPDRSVVQSAEPEVTPTSDSHAQHESSGASQTSHENRTREPNQFASGHQVGEVVPTFYSRAVTGPLMNKSVCYVCRNGNRPVVMMLVREMTPELRPLFKNLDRLVDQNRASGLRSFGVLLSEEPRDAISNVQTFAFDSKIQMPLTVGTSALGGPSCLKLHSDAAVTIVLYRDKKVIANFAFRSGELQTDDIREILSEVRTLAGIAENRENPRGNSQAGQ